MAGAELHGQPDSFVKELRGEAGTVGPNQRPKFRMHLKRPEVGQGLEQPENRAKRPVGQVNFAGRAVVEPQLDHVAPDVFRFY